MAILSDITLYPIKSCGGIAVREATLTRAGLRIGALSEQIHDREWMVVDGDGNYLTQREHPKLALVTPRIEADKLALHAPGMPGLEIPLALPDPVSAPTRMVQLWDLPLKAYDCDEPTAAWFSRFLGLPCRLVRFHPDAQNLASMKWTGSVAAPTLFSDGYPVLVIGAESLRDLNGRLQQAGREPLPMNRFRPNLVIDGLGAYEEDYIATFDFDGAVLKPVKPCPRCPMPSVDQATGTFGPDPLDILHAYRAKPEVDGGICFGMNTILLEGEGRRVHVGQQVDAELAF